MEYNTTNDNQIVNYESNTLKHKIEVHQYVFYTIDLTKGYIYLPSVFAMISFSIDSSYDGNNIVIPAPLYNAGNYCFGEFGDYYSVKNSIACENMVNEHDDNQNNGYYFTTAYAKYDGKKYIQVQEDQFDVYSVAIDLLSLFPQVAVVSDFVSLAEIASNIFRENAETIRVNVTNEEHIEEMNFLVPDKQGQISEYGSIIKSLAYKLRELEFIYDDYIEYRFVFSHDEDENKSVTCKSKIYYEIFINGSFEKGITHTNEFRIIGDDAKTSLSNLKLFENCFELTNQYNLVNTYQEYTFIPTNSQLYTINATNGQIVNVYNGEIEISRNNGFYLQKDTGYTIRVTNISGVNSKYSLIIDYPLYGSDVCVPAKGEYYLKYECERSDVYFLDSNNENVQIKYDDNLKDIKYLAENNRYVISLINRNDNDEYVTPMILNPSLSGTKYIYNTVDVSGEYMITASSECLQLIDGLLKDVMYYKPVYVNAGNKIYSKTSISFSTVSYSYIVYLNDDEVQYQSINRVTIGRTINLNVKQYINGIYYGDYTNYNSVYPLLSKMDSEIHHVVLYNNNDGFDFDFYIAPNNPTISSISYSNYILNDECIVKMNITFNEDFSGKIEYEVSNIYSDKCNYINGIGTLSIKLNNNRLKGNDFKYYKLFVYAKYVGNDDYSYVNSEECRVSIDEALFKNYILSSDFSNNYLDYLHNKVNRNYSYNSVISDYYYYIKATINLDYNCYNIERELQLLLVLNDYEENMEISYDDGINYDSYIYGDAMIHNIRILNNLNYKYECVFNLHKSYLYADFYGLNKMICNLHITNDKYLFIANYGNIENVRFCNCNFRNVFGNSGPGEEWNVTNY